jgi:hypothetical protein
MVKKADGSWRPCGDFRRLNLVTEPDVYPLPNMLDFAAKAAGCTVFSKIDLRIPVIPADVQKTAITTPFGLFEYKRMPFGLRNAGPSFQRHVDRAIRDCQAAFAWVDDIVICSRNHEEHVIHVRQVLQALQDNGLVIHAEKCVWGVQELEYLGHKISAAGVLPLPSHVAATRLPKYSPPSPPSECVLPPTPKAGGGGVHTRLAVREGGSIFWKTPEIGLASYSIISLR